MRICLYTSTALPKIGGQEMAVDALARQMGRLGHQIVVLAPQPRLPLRVDDSSRPYPVERHPRFISTRHLVSWYRWWLLRLHHRQRFEILHCHGIYPVGYLAGLARPLLDVPVVITSHGGDLNFNATRLKKPSIVQRSVQALQNADALVSISRFTRDGFLQLWPQARSIVDIPNGVDYEDWAAAAPRPAGLDDRIESGRYALFLGRLAQRKGVDVLLKALARLPASEAVQLVIAGEGQEKPRLTALASELGISKRVLFVGAVFGRDKAYLLQNALCTVMPSRVWESFGLVAIESFAAGTPVIASQLPGLGDLVEPGRTGWLVPPEAPDALAIALRQAFSNPLQARAMGTAARQVARRYRWESVAQRHLVAYQELLSRRSARHAA